MRRPSRFRGHRIIFCEFLQLARQYKECLGLSRKKRHRTGARLLLLLVAVVLIVVVTVRVVVVVVVVKPTANQASEPILELAVRRAGTRHFCERDQKCRAAKP